MSVNKVLLLGRLGKDPELKYTPGGAAVCNFSVATTETWTDKQGNKQEKTEWTRIVVWGKLAELCNQYLAKGRQAFIEGRLETRSWEKDGQKHYVTEVIASTVQFIGGAPGGNRGAGDSNQSSGPEQEAANSGKSENKNQEYQISNDAHFASDDIPF